MCHIYGRTGEPGDREAADPGPDRERRKAHGWWNQYPQLPAMVEYVALEDIATSIRTWQLAFIPGLLQTPDYARAVAVGASSWEPERDRAIGRGEAGPSGATAVGTTSRTLGRAPPRGRCANSWAVEVMREQLGQLLDLADMDTVKVRWSPGWRGRTRA